MREEGTSNAQGSRKVEILVKRKRGGEKEPERVHRKGKESTSEALEERNKVEGLVNTTVSLDAKGRKFYWRNFHASMRKMGLVREHINPKVLEGRDGKN